MRGADADMYITLARSTTVQKVSAGNLLLIEFRAALIICFYFILAYIHRNIFKDLN